jgi:hypothetical protein
MAKFRVILNGAEIQNTPAAMERLDAEVQAWRTTSVAVTEYALGGGSTGAPTGEHRPEVSVSGYVVVEATDAAAAKALGKSHPLVKHGASITVTDARVSRDIRDPRWRPAKVPKAAT